MDLLTKLTKAMSIGLALLMAESNVLPVYANEDQPLPEPRIVTNAEELRDAITNAEDNASLVVGADIDYDQGVLGTIAITKNITIDCGEHKISVIMGETTGSYDGLFDINSGAGLTLKNAEINQDKNNLIGTNDGNLVIESTKGTGISTECVIGNNNGSVTVINGTFNTTYCFVDECPGFMEIMNGVFRSDDYVFDSIGGKLIIHNADVIAEGPCVSVDSSPTIGEAEIFGGSFVANYECVSNYGKVTLHPGTSFESTKDGSVALYTDGGNYYLAEDGYPTIPMENWDTAGKIKIMVNLSAPVKINWVGPEAQQVEVKLLADGVENQSLTVTKSDSWEATFSDLPKYVEDDLHEIAYSVVPSAIPGYDSQISGNVRDGFIITYTVTGKVSFPVSVVWKGGTGDRTIVHLLADGTEVAKQELNTGNQWNFTFTDYDRYTDGKEINYTLSVDNVPGYSTKVAWVSGEGFIVTNTKIEASSDTPAPTHSYIPVIKPIVPKTAAKK